MTSSGRRSEQLAGVTIDNKYRVVERIGSGGGGIVYRAEQLQIERFVAIKVLHSELVADEQALMRFRDEAKLACKITHPNAVCIYDYGVFEGLPYLVMELVSGKTLREIIKTEKCISPARALSLVGTICETLAEAHSLGIVHRDLKPDNIMVCPKADGSEWVEVLDFGVASMWRSLEGPDSSQWSFVGTPQYVAPEQLEKGDSDARADIYSIGVLLYEMLCGSNPFNGQTAMECLYKHMNHVPGSLRREHPHLKITQGLDDLIERCLEKDPGKRFQTTPELLEELRACELAYERNSGRRWFYLGAGLVIAAVGVYVLTIGTRVQKEETLLSNVLNNGNQHVIELNRSLATSSARAFGSSMAVASSSIASVASVASRGAITIESRGRVAKVLLNGENYGDTPLRNLSLAPGEYELLLRCEGCEEYSERIEIESGVSVKRVVDIALIISSAITSAGSSVVSSVAGATASSFVSSVANSIDDSSIAPMADSATTFSDDGFTTVTNNRGEATTSSSSSVATGDSFLSLVKRAEEKYRRGLYSEAVPLFEAALSKKDNVRARLSLGNCFLRLRQYNEAEVHFKSALQQAPYHAPVHFNLACLYALKGQREEAIRSISRTIELDGLSRFSLRDEPDLRSVIDDPRVKRLLR